MLVEAWPSEFCQHRQGSSQTHSHSGGGGKEEGEEEEERAREEKKKLKILKFCFRLCSLWDQEALLSLSVREALKISIRFRV